MANHVTSGGVTFEVSSRFFFIDHMSHIVPRLLLNCAAAVVLWTCVIVAFFASLLGNYCGCVIFMTPDGSNFWRFCHFSPLFGGLLG